MTKSKTVVLAIVALSLFTIGCASGGAIKPTVFVDKPNNIPADIPLQFDSRYERFISDKEMEAFHKLPTDDERQAFQDKFWLDRDPNPLTPENERKQEIEDRIDDIAGERFFGASGSTGLLFRTNGGFRGDMAKVYLLHGEPDAMDTIEGNNLFVNLMLWIYGNPENGDIRYAFLFYQKGGGGSFLLFSQDAYQMDPCAALYEVATLRIYNYPGGGIRACPDDLNQVYNDIRNASGKGGILDGRYFAWSLFNFSTDSSLKQWKALEPPKPASEIAKQSKARVTGEAPKLTGKAGTDYILASCEKCNSMMPANIFLGERFVITGPYKNFDWTVNNGDGMTLSLKYRIVFEDHNGGTPTVKEGTVDVLAHKNWLEESPEEVVPVHLLEPEQIATIPPGTYRVSVYVQNMLTKKYNAWSREFTK